MALETVTISDAVFGSRAKILPGLGFNCYGFSVPTPGGPLETLWSAPDFTDGTAKPTRSGIPLLFPFAGRIRGTSFRFQDRQYALEVGDELGNAIHGFVYSRPWRVIDQAADRVVGQFQASVDDPSLAAHWPADFRITATYRVAGNTLAAEYQIENPDDRPLPFGFGTHAYFRVPLGGPSADDCRVRVPVATVWEMEDLLPTGREVSSPLATRLAQGMRFGDMKLDNVFGGLVADGDRFQASIHDPGSGRTLVQTFDSQFAACVVFNPPHREAVCMEPYTTLPDPFTLRERDVDAKLRILPPGAVFRASIEIRLD
jgi:aldose 1-epimerase